MDFGITPGEKQQTMPILSGKLGRWNVPHLHMWKDRASDFQMERRPLLGPTTRVATIGSCFASELADAMARLGLAGEMHPAGLFYNSRSIRQEFERIFGGGWEGWRQEVSWRVKDGFVHPFKDQKRVFSTEAELQRFSDDIDRRAQELFRTADVIVVTLGLIETWWNPVTRNTYLQIPHPDAFPAVGSVFSRLTVAEILEDMQQVRALVRENTKAELIVTVSPVPLHATMTALDVRVANMESKSRIRAAVSELTERFPDVHYFHSFELVATAERLSEFMMEDGLHVHRHAVDYILREFMRQFAGPGMGIPNVDTGWLTAPSKLAARPISGKITERLESTIRGLMRRASRLASTVQAFRS